MLGPPQLSGPPQLRENVATQSSLDGIQVNRIMERYLFDTLSTSDAQCCALSDNPDVYRMQLACILQNPWIELVCILPQEYVLYWISGTVQTFPVEFNRLMSDFSYAHFHGYIAYTHGLFPTPKEYSDINTMLKTSDLLTRHVRGPIMLRRMGHLLPETIQHKVSLHV